MTRSTDQGTDVLLTADGGQTLFLMGQGASPEGNRPFLRRMDLATGELDEIFRSEAPYYEVPVAIMEAMAAPVMRLRSASSKVAARCLSAAELEPGPPLKKKSVFSVSPAVGIPQVTEEKSAPVRTASRKAFMRLENPAIFNVAPEKSAPVRSTNRKAW